MKSLLKIPKKIIVPVKLIESFQEFFKSNIASSIFLLTITIAVMFVANTSLYEYYHNVLEYKLGIVIGGVFKEVTIHHFINDFLMAIFFFLVGLEIKREILIGELSNVKKAVLPIIGAFGGVVFPAIIYTLFNYNTIYQKGWAIPMATDIAFAIGVLALLGNRIPLGLKVFLAALAIVDDLAAVIVIAIFYTPSLDSTYLLNCLLVIIALATSNYIGIRNMTTYLILGFLLLLFTYSSGVHSTIAGVITALFIPAKKKLEESNFVEEVENLWDKYKKDEDYTIYDVTHTLKKKFNDIVSPLVKMEHGLQKFVAFVVMPLFAFANAGLHFDSLNASLFTNTITLGIIFGLFIGKPLGITSLVYIANKIKLVELPDGITIKQIFAVSILCGIGFTMSLFVSSLSFGNNSIESIEAKIGILLGSIVSGIIGYLVLRK